MAAGTIPVRQALEKALHGMSVPLVTRKGVRAGFVRVKMKHEFPPPEIFVAHEDESVLMLKTIDQTNDGENMRIVPIVVFCADREPLVAVPEPRRRDSGCSSLPSSPCCSPKRDLSR
eukprot:TRINITY_DN5093_c0_g2_i1.p2 TRINITY_DN5093_c0_g2~~TRINITY_DN5093_c0_g2_i1.p2  ORF type:complete len:117 (-),score=15.15 TRINITY_DN5093_c0_g2_i1:849-1199(-)